MSGMLSEMSGSCPACPVHSGHDHVCLCPVMSGLSVQNVRWLSGVSEASRCVEAAGHVPVISWVIVMEKSTTGSGMDPAACPIHAALKPRLGTLTAVKAKRVCECAHSCTPCGPKSHFNITLWLLMLKFILSKEKVRKKKAGVLEITLCKFEGLKMTSW